MNDEELVGKLGCVVILIGLALVVLYLEKDLARDEKAKNEATMRTWSSFNREVETILPSLDSYGKEPERGSSISGKYLVWELKMNDQSTAHQIDPPDKTKGAVQSFSIYPALEGDPYGPSKTPTIAIVRWTLRDSAMYRETFRTQGGKFVPPRPGLEEVRTYNCQVWIMDRGSKQITGYKQFFPDVLPQSGSGNIEAQIKRHQIDQVFGWLESLYAQLSNR